MSIDRSSLETKIADVIQGSISGDRKLSKKAILRIEKSARKLSERLIEIFEKEDKKAAKKALGEEDGE